MTFTYAELVNQVKIAEEGAWESLPDNVKEFINDADEDDPIEINYRGSPYKFLNRVLFSFTGFELTPIDMIEIHGNPQPSIKTDSLKKYMGNDERLDYFLTCLFLHRKAMENLYQTQEWREGAREDWMWVKHGWIGYQGIIKTEDTLLAEAE